MNVQITPSVVIGIGGTGFDVVHALSEEFYETYGDVPVVQFLAFDTDKSNGSCTKCANFEFIHLTVDNAGEYLEGMRRGYYPGLKAWLPENITVGNLNSGAKNNRLLGRFALFTNISRIRNSIDEKLYFITKKRIDQKTQARHYGVSKELKVFIVNSGSGGCGSGMFLDIAYSVRDLLGMRQNVAVAGYMITPKVFHISDNNLTLSGNAYAAFKELNYFMDARNTFECVYDNRLTVKSEVKPFDYYYILDSAPDGQISTLTYPDVIPIIRDAIKLEIVSTIGKRLDGLRTNEDDVLTTYFEDTQTHRLYPQAYGSFGTEAYYYPGREYKELCSNLYTQRLIETFLSKPNGFNSAVESSYNALTTLKQLGFSIEEMKKGLVCDYKNGNYTEGVPREILVDSLRCWKDAEVKRVRLSNLTETARRQVASTLKQHMHNTLKSILNDSTQGLPVALQIFQKLETQISDNITALGTATDGVGLIQRQETNIKEIEESCDSILKEIREIIDTKYSIHMFSKGSRIGTQTSLYIDGTKNLIDAHIESLKLDSIRDTCIELKGEIICIQKSLDNLAGNLENIKRKLNNANSSAQAALMSMDSAGANHLIGNTENELKINCDKFHQPVDQLHKRICDQGIDSWLNYTSDQLTKTLTEYGKAQYADVKFDISGVIGDNLRGLLESLCENTHVTMTYTGQDRGFSHLRLPEFCLLGVPEHLYEKCRNTVNELPGGSKINVVATSDDYKISYVIYKYGLPIIAMRPIPELKREYDATPTSKPMHIFGLGDKLPDIVCELPKIKCELPVIK